jgi:hypothetical protein
MNDRNIQSEHGQFRIRWKKSVEIGQRRQKLKNRLNNDDDDDLIITKFFNTIFCKTMRLMPS